VLLLLLLLLAGLKRGISSSSSWASSASSWSAYHSLCLVPAEVLTRPFLLLYFFAVDFNNH
jgi:hypothetical protein